METLKTIWDALSLMPFYPRWAQMLFLASFALVVASVVAFSNFYSKAQEGKARQTPVAELSLTDDEELALGLVLTDPQAGTRGAWAYPLHQELTYRGLSEAAATTVLNSLATKGLLEALDVPTYDEVEKKESTAPAYRVTERGFAYAAKSDELRDFESHYKYILRLNGTQQRNGPFLEQLRRLDSVQGQTRFIIETDPKMSRIAIFSYKALDENLIRNLAKSFKVSIVSFDRER